MELSDDWFFESSRRRARPRASWIPLLMVILVFVNAGVVYYFVDQAINEVKGLEGELDEIRFQLSATNLEIATLKESIKIQSQGNVSDNLDLISIYNESKMSVVLIIVSSSFGGGQGSGFVYDLEGRIITNNHVVEDAEEITVTFVDGTIVDATLIGTDPYSDLAVIDMDLPEEFLKPLDMASSIDLLVGEQVVALGNPFGLANTMTVGIISATGRQMDAPGGYTIVDVIQTDAAINPGDSGGPVIQGDRMIGVAFQGIKGADNIGYMIPSPIIRHFLKDIEDGRFDGFPDFGG